MLLNPIKTLQTLFSFKTCVFLRRSSVWVGRAGSEGWARWVCWSSCFSKRFQSLQPEGSSGAAGGAETDSYRLPAATPQTRRQRAQWVACSSESWEIWETCSRLCGYFQRNVFLMAVTKFRTVPVWMLRKWRIHELPLRACCWQIFDVLTRP